MQIDVYSEDGEKKEKLATFTVKGIDEVANNTVARKEGSSQPKVTLSFELTRSGLIQLNKAEAKIEETYVVEEKPPVKSKILNVTKDNSTDNTTEENANSTNSDNESSEESEPHTIKKTKKRTIPYPLFNIEKQFYGQPTLTNDQLKKCKERLRLLEKRDDDKAKTDKAKNDFEAIIYALRDWINEDENVPFVGGADQ